VVELVVSYFHAPPPFFFLKGLLSIVAGELNLYSLHRIEVRTGKYIVSVDIMACII